MKIVICAVLLIACYWSAYYVLALSVKYLRGKVYELLRKIYVDFLLLMFEFNELSTIESYTDAVCLNDKIKD